MSLRPYQSEALKRSLERMLAGCMRQVIVHPTGTGKSLIVGNLRSHHGMDGKVLVLVHREELAQQNAAHLRRWNPGVNVGVEMASRRSSDWDEIVVASVATIGREGSPRLKKFRPEDFSAVIVDEAHHSTARQYKTVFDHFGVSSPDSGRLLLGVTATPNRSDGTPLGEVFDEIVHQFTLRQAIDDGWLVDLKAMQVRTGTSLDRVRVRAGDFAVNELEATVNTPERNKLIVASWLKAAAPRQAVAFCVDVQHAHDLAATFTANGVRCAAVWGAMENRAEVLGAFKRRDIDVLASVSVLSEGWDYPGLECVLLCRPTKSRLVVAQQVGRATRLPEGVSNLREAERQGVQVSKRDALVIDFVDNASRHSLAGIGSLVGLGDKLDFAGKSVVGQAKRFEQALQDKPRLDLMRINSVDELDLALTQVDMFRDVVPEPIAAFAGMTWNQYSENEFQVSLPGRGSIRVSQNILGHWDIAITRPEAADADALRISTDAPPQFGSAQDAIGWAERLLKSSGYGALLSVKAKWRRDAPTDAQLKFARKLRIAVPAGATKGEVSRAIDLALAARGRH